MNKLTIICLVNALAIAGSVSSRAADVLKVSKEITAAVSDPSRPSTDTERDANRKPLETLAFLGVKPGDKVADYAPGSGYFTRLFSNVVQSTGHVYSAVPSPLFQYPNIVKGTSEILTFAASHPNVTVTFGAVRDTVRFAEPLDLLWISQNYHDLHHSAARGAPADVTDTLHRIEPSVGRQEVEAVGFVLQGESAILANPADPRTLGVFDKSIRGHTDQFILKFQKPKR